MLSGRHPSQNSKLTALPMLTNPYVDSVALQKVASSMKSLQKEIPNGRSTNLG